MKINTWNQIQMEKCYDIKQLATTKRNEITIYAHSKEGKREWEKCRALFGNIFLPIY